MTATGAGRTYTGRVDRPEGDELRRGRERRTEIAFHLGLLVVGVTFAVGVGAAPIGDYLAVQIIVVYTILVGVAAGVLAVALLLTAALPGVSERQIDGERGRGFHAWRGDWIFSVGVDIGLVVLGVVLIVLGVRDVESWAPFTIPGAAVTAWFAVRVLLVVTGRRRNEALWLTDEHLVHDSADGRARLRRDDVSAIVSGKVSMVVLAERPVDRQGPPPGWRPYGRAQANELRIDCALTGPTAEQLQRWLEDQLGRTATSTSRTRPSH